MIGPIVPRNVHTTRPRPSLPPSCPARTRLASSEHVTFGSFQGTVCRERLWTGPHKRLSFT